MEPTSLRLKISLSGELRQTEFPDPSEPPSQQLRTKPCKPFYLPTYSATPTPKRPSFTNSSATSALPNHELPDHPEQSKRNKLWKQQSQCSAKTSQNQSTSFQNTPQATDAGSEHQGYIQLKSQSYSTMKSKRNATEINSRETKWPKFSNKTPTYQTDSQKNTIPHRRNSRRIQLWLWSRKQSPPTCSLNTAKTVKKNQNQKICLHGEIHSSTSRKTQQNTNTKPDWPDLLNQARQPRRRRLLSGSYEGWRRHHSRFKQSARWKRHSTFSQTQTRKISQRKNTKTPTTGKLSPKRRSESEGYNQESEGYNRQSESHNQYKRIKSKNNIKSENEDIEVKKEGKLRTLLKSAKAKVTAKADEVKALEKTLKEFRVEKEKQVDKKIEAESSVTLPPHFATTFNISILTFTIFIFTFNILFQLPIHWYQITIFKHVPSEISAIAKCLVYHDRQFQLRRRPQ
jgi:hypothetical protein